MNCLLKSLIYSSLLLVCLDSVRAGWGKAEPEPGPDPIDQDDDEQTSTRKTCEMVCHIKSRQTRDWTPLSLWTAIKGGYTCRWQQLGKKMLDNIQYADITIDYQDLQNSTHREYAHMSVLHWVSDDLQTLVKTTVDRHVTDTTRDRLSLPSIWLRVKLPQEVVKSVLEYIYTDRMRDFDPRKNIIALYVAAHHINHKELMTMVVDYLEDSYYTVEQLNQLVIYLRYAHDMRLSDGGRLKTAIIEIARKILKLSPKEFEQFIDNICESNGYQRVWLPGQRGPTQELPDTSRSTERFREDRGFDRFGGGMDNRPIDTRAPADSRLDANVRPLLPVQPNLIDDLKSRMEKDHKLKLRSAPYDDKP